MSKATKNAKFRAHQKCKMVVFGDTKWPKFGYNMWELLIKSIKRMCTLNAKSPE